MAEVIPLKLVDLGSGNGRLEEFAEGETIPVAMLPPQGTYTWTQSLALAVWTIPHNLDKYPSVTVVDGLGVRIEPDVVYADSNIVTVTHSAALAGKAYLN